MATPEHPPILSEAEAQARLMALPRPWAADYLAMYSNWLGGIVREPWLMSVPIDDHLVHRGDGVFEAMKCVAGRIYQCDAHLERLARSAQSIHLELPLDLGALKRLVVDVTRAGGEPDSMVRLYISRGPGGFSTNPYECCAPGVYVMVSRLHSPAPESYQRGVRAGISLVPSKSGFYASVKSCNYLPNVLLKREAVVRGWDFSLGLDENGHLAEGSTENVGLVDSLNRLLLPLPDHILEGTTVRRVIELAEALVEKGVLSRVEHRPLERADLDKAKEILLFGTTLDVLPVTRLEGEPVGDGAVGPVAKALLELVRQDIRHNPAVSTPVFV
ncbi:MAG: aminotransferase class IV [Desulfarculus sp.]|nr:aminotransferase class IV [Desulfarculus sp.]